MIYYCKKHNLIIISSEVPVSSEFAFEMSDDITELMKKYKAKKAFVLEGLISKNETPDKKKVFGVPGNAKMKKFLGKNKIEVIKTGAIIGVAGSVLLSSVEKRLNCCALMAESHVNIPDALAASNVLKKLSKIIGFKINTKDLDKKGAEIEKKIKTIMSTMKKYKSRKNSDEKNKVLYG
jgi:predicted ATP-grasp superfamily ATP-dependent carboligase